MLTIFPLSQPNMLGFTLDGEIDEAGMRKFTTAVEAKVLTHGKIRLLGNIKNIGGWDTFQTFWSTMKSKKDLWGKIERYAILTDNVVIEKATDTMDWFTNDMNVKTFQLSEGETAHQWLAGQPEAKEAKEAKALKFVDLGHPNLLGLAIIDKMEVIDFEKLNYYIDDHAGQYGKVRLYLEIVNLKGISFRALWEDIKTSVQQYGKLERVAIIGDQAWLKASVKVGDVLTPGLDLAAFGSEDRQRAIAWLD